MSDYVEDTPTEEPVVDEPVVDEPEPVVDEPAGEAVEEPVVDEPAAEAVEEPVVDEPEPVVDEPAVEAVEEPEMGDIVVFPRGDQGWQGHVGFYVKSQEIDGVLYYYILGGNQKNSVRVDLYRADKAIGIRRSSK